jgi:hypothetical protein
MKNTLLKDNKIGKVYILEYKFQMCSLHHIMGDDISRATKGVTNVIMVPKTKMLSKVIIATM